jgi:hypothetical protein
MEICFEGAYAYAQLQAGAFPTAAKCPPTQEPVQAPLLSGASLPSLSGKRPSCCMQDSRLAQKRPNDLQLLIRVGRCTGP